MVPLDTATYFNAFMYKHSMWYDVFWRHEAVQEEKKNKHCILWYNLFKNVGGACENIMLKLLWSPSIYIKKNTQHINSAILSFLKRQSLLSAFFTSVVKRDDHDDSLMSIPSNLMCTGVCVFASIFLKSTISSLVLLTLSSKLFSVHNSAGLLIFPHSWGRCHPHTWQ